MVTALDQLHAERELIEVVGLGCSQAVIPEEGNDHLKQVIPPVDAVPPEVLFVVVVAPIDVERPHSEELTEHSQRLGASSTLDDHEAMTDLPSGLIAFAARVAGLANEAD